MINDARFQLFTRNYMIQNIDEPFQKKLLHNLDACNLPPCQTELKQQLLRARYIANVWKNAHDKIPSELEPDNYGWLCVENRYEFLWFQGEQFPNTVKEIIFDTEDPEGDINENENISYNSDEDIQFN